MVSGVGGEGRKRGKVGELWRTYGKVARASGKVGGRADGWAGGGWVVSCALWDVDSRVGVYGVWLERAVG